MSVSTEKYVKHVPDYFKMFAKPFRDESTDMYQYVNIPDNNNNTNLNTLTYIDFHTKDIDNFYLPAKGYIQATVKIVKTDGSAYAATDRIALVNNGLSLFSDAIFKIEEKILERKQDHLGIGSTVMNLLEYSDDYSKSAGTNQGWFPDTGLGGHNGNTWVSGDGADHVTKHNELITYNSVYDAGTLSLGTNGTQAISHNVNFNHGFNKRQQMYAGSNTAVLFLPLDRIFGFLKDSSIAIKGQRISIRLQRNDNHNQILHRHAGYATADATSFFAVAEGRVELIDIRLWMPVIRPSIAMELDLNTQFKNGQESIIPFRQWEMYRYATQLAGVNKGSWRIASLSHKPITVCVFFQNSNKSGDQSLNGMIFDNLNLSRMYVRINDRRFPMEDLLCDFELSGERKNLWSRAYQMFLEKRMNTGSDGNSIISYYDFAVLYPVFVFDVSKIERSIFSNTSVIDIVVEWELAAVAPSNYDPYCLVESEREIAVKGVGERMKIII